MFRLLEFERQVTSPGARGVVLDAQTHSPLVGADVVVSRLYELSTNPSVISEALANARPTVVTTGKDGRFRIPAEQHHELIVDYLIQRYRARVARLLFSEQAISQRRFLFGRHSQHSRSESHSGGEGRNRV
jgi:hypothetical protein